MVADAFCGERLRIRKIDPLNEGAANWEVERATVRTCWRFTVDDDRGSLADPENLTVSTRLSLGRFRDVAWSPDGAYVALAVDYSPGFVIIPRDELWTYGETP